MIEKQLTKMDDLLSMATENKLGKCFENKMCSVGQDTIKSIDAVFDEIDDIHTNRHKYDLHWAFEDAQERLKDFTTNIWKDHLALKEESYALKPEFSENLDKLETFNQAIEKKMKRKFKWFSSIPNIVTFVEMGISLLMVIGLSKLSHSGESLIHSAYLSLAFVGIMAFFKVTLEKYWLKPQIDKWGWKLYLQSSKRMREVIVRLLGTTVAIREYLQANTTSEYDVDIVDGFVYDHSQLVETALLSV